MTSLRHHPLGAAVPETPHAVCCSLPTMADIIGYEEKTPETLAALKAGYPRFVSHRFVRMLAQELQDRNGWEDRHVFAVSSLNSVPPMLQFTGTPGAGYEEIEDGVVAVHFPNVPEAWESARNFLQHTGVSVSSRQAEDWLAREQLVDTVFSEELAEGTAESASRSVRGRIAKAAGADAGDVLLCSSGMNAFWSVFQTTMDFQRLRGRGIWLKLGWIYVDTGEILEKFLRGNGEQVVSLYQIADEAALRAAFEEHGPRIAGVICEAPTNPLVQTPDLELVSELCRAHGAVCVLDPSIAGMLNVSLLPLADVVTTSLTKYAASEGDVMAGAIVLNRQSPYAPVYAEGLGFWREPLYPRDLRRLARQMDNWEALTADLNANAGQLAAWLEEHPRVRKVWWAGEPGTRQNFERVARDGLASCGAVLTLELEGELAAFYDNLRVVKGPSFGTTFTMACPFLYLAHYPLASTEEGRRWLRSLGIDPDLVRLSVGCEPFAEIRDAIDEALSM